MNLKFSYTFSPTTVLSYVSIFSNSFDWYMNSVLSRVTYNESYNTHQKSDYGFLSRYVLFNVVIK